MNNCYLSIEDKVLVSTDKNVEIRDNHIDIENELELENRIEKLNNTMYSNKRKRTHDFLVYKSIRRFNNILLTIAAFMLFLVNPLTIALSISMLLVSNIFIDKTIKKEIKKYENIKTILLNDKNKLVDELLHLRKNKTATKRINSKVLEHNNSSREEVVKLYYLRDKLVGIKNSQNKSIEDIWSSEEMNEFKGNNYKLKNKKL